MVTTSKTHQIDASCFKTNAEGIKALAEAHQTLAAREREFRNLSLIDAEELVKRAEAVHKYEEAQILREQKYDIRLARISRLRELGVSNARIFAESFGISSLEREESSSNIEQLPIAEEAIINFTESHVEQAWSKDDGTLLEFAEAHGLTPEYGCRSGKCGACKVKLLSGKVTYKQAISSPLEDGEILLCSAVPAAEEGIEHSRLEIKL